MGKIGKTTRKIAVFTVYIPPRTKAADHAELCRALSIEIACLKANMKDPLIVIGGDFNHRDISEALIDFNDLCLLQTGPTGGPNRLDLLYTNFNNPIQNHTIIPPLELDGRIHSNHKCVQAVAHFPPTKGYEWTTKMVRKRLRKADQAFASDLAAWNWRDLYQEVDVNQRVDIFEKAVQLLCNKHFPLVRTQNRSNEDPWITPVIRRLWKRKLGINKKKGKNANWKLTDIQLQGALEEAKENYVERTIEQGARGSPSLQPRGVSLPLGPQGSGTSMISSRRRNQK